VYNILIQSCVLCLTRYIPAFALLQRMLNFVQSFQYYMTMEVLEPNWSAFEKKLAKVSTIDDVLQAHTDFLDSSLRDCLLSDRNILKTVSRLMELCLHFSGHMQEQVEGGEEDDSLSLSREELGDSGRRMARVISVDLDSLLSPENFCQSIARIEAQFMGDLLALQDTLLELHVDSLSHMVSRLDYNSFYHSLRLTN
jgi:gamma-tubulin complex component 2